MKILLDQGAAHFAAELLRQRGHDAHHVIEVGLDGATDPEIIEFAFQNGYVIVTWDADFHNRIVLSGKTKPSCVRVRIEGIVGGEQASLVHDIVSTFQDDLLAGALVSVARDGARMRRLPVE